MSAGPRESRSDARAAAPDAPYPDETPTRPEPDLYSADLPLGEPPPGLSADFVTDVTQLYLTTSGSTPSCRRRKS